MITNKIPSVPIKSVVVYSSITGFTRKYAEWIAEDLSCDIYSVKDITLEKLLEYDIIIYGGSLHASGITGIKIIKTNLSKLTNKKLVIFATGASPYKEKLLDEIREKNFTPEEGKQVKIFYLRGGFNYSKLNLTNKVLMFLFKWSILMKPREKRTPDEISMLASYDHPVDFTKQENTKEILDFIKNLV